MTRSKEFDRRARPRDPASVRSSDIDRAIQVHLAGLIDDEPLRDDAVSMALVQQALRAGLGESRTSLRPVQARAELPVHRPLRRRVAVRWVALGACAAAVVAWIGFARLRSPAVPSDVSTQVAQRGEAPAIVPLDPPERRSTSKDALAEVPCVSFEPGARLCLVAKPEVTATPSEAIPSGEEPLRSLQSNATITAAEFAGYVVYMETTPEATSSPLRPSTSSIARDRLEPKPRVRPAAAMFSAARDALTRGRAREAAEAYEELLRVHPKAPEARPAMVALAQLNLHALGRPKAAERLFRTYLRGAGGSGALALEARSGRIQALAQLHRTRDEAAAIRDFLRHHGETDHARVLRQRLDELH